MSPAMFRRDPGPQPPEERREPSDELTPEELALAQRAHEEAARRAAQRRTEASDVSDLLGGMLEVPREPSDSAPGRPGESARPNVGMVLEGDVWTAGSAAPTPFAPFAEEAPEGPVSAPEDREVLAGGPRPSTAMADVLTGLMALGATPGKPALAFEDESAAVDYSRTMTMLAAGRRQRPPGISFERDEPPPGAESSKLTMMLPLSAVSEAQAPTPFRDAVGGRQAGGGEDAKSIVEPAAEEPPPAPEYSIDDLPGVAGSGAGRGGPAPRGEDGPGEAAMADDDLGGADLLSAPAAAEPPADERTKDREYGLDDLPAAPANASSSQERADDEAEAALDEASLDERGLDAVLAGADRAGPAAGLAHDQASDAGDSGQEGGEQTEPPAPREYGLNDLPQAPSGAGGGGGFSSEAPPSDDRMNEVSLPDFSVPGEVPPAAPPMPSEGFTEVEKEVERRADPSGTENAAAGSDAVPAEPGAAAERAADLSARQLSDVERFLERSMDDDSGAEHARALVRRSTLGTAFFRLFHGPADAVSQVVVKLVAWADRRLAPYGLSCKLLLGITGILILVLVGALSYKTWILRR